MMKRIALTTLAGLMLTGCGTTPNAPTFGAIAHVPGAAKSAANAQTIKVPAAFAGSGAIAMAFQFPAASAYHVAATTAQVEKLVVTLKTRSFLLTKTVATAEVTRAQMKNGQAAVRFDGLKAGDYTVAIQAFDAAGNSLGSSEGAAAVAEGKVSPVAIDLRLNGTTATPAPTTSTGGLALTVTISDGGVAPIPAPTAKPVPTPVPTAKPVPAPAGAWNTDVNVLRAASFKGCLFGSNSQDSVDNAESWARKLGRQLDINHSYYDFSSTIPSAEDKSDVAAGRIPLISLNSHRNGKDVLWADVAAGKEDAKLREVAQGMKSLGKPVFFCYNHEPENDGSRGTPAEYRAAWKHVSDIIAQEKATNVVKVLIIMGYKDADEYYPGDAVVDWIGGDPYNWAYSNNNPTAKWNEFDGAVKHFYTWASKYNKPLMLGETGCNEDAADPTRRAKWIAGMAASAKKLPLLKAICYFNYKSATSNNFYINTPEALAAYKAMGQDPYYLVH